MHYLPTRRNSEHGSPNTLLSSDCSRSPLILLSYLNVTFLLSVSHVNGIYTCLKMCCFYFVLFVSQCVAKRAKNIANQYNCMKNQSGWEMNDDNRKYLSDGVHTQRISCTHLNTPICSGTTSSLADKRRPCSLQLAYGSNGAISFNRYCLQSVSCLSWQVREAKHIISFTVQLLVCT